MAHGLGTAIRFLHILFGVAWIGGMLFSMHAVMGGLRKLPPPIMGQAMGAIQRKAFGFYGVAGGLTILFGVWNQYLMTGALEFQGAPWNVLLGASLVLAVLMLGLGFGVNLPAFRRMMALAPEARAGPVGQALQKRMMIVGITTMVLGLTALGLMVRATALRAGP